jgi:ribonuclease VapC
MPLATPEPAPLPPNTGFLVSPPMVIDASAVLAVLLGEEDAAIYANAIEDAADPNMSAVSGLEVTLVISARKREPGLAALDRFMEKSRIRVIPFDGEQLHLAREAWWNYGKGRHSAGAHHKLGGAPAGPWLLGRLRNCSRVLPSA